MERNSAEQVSAAKEHDTSAHAKMRQHVLYMVCPLEKGLVGQHRERTDWLQQSKRCAGGLRSAGPSMTSAVETEAQEKGNPAEKLDQTIANV
jgi:hypothetical protein